MFDPQTPLMPAGEPGKCEVQVELERILAARNRLAVGQQRTLEVLRAVLGDVTEHTPAASGGAESVDGLLPGLRRLAELLDQAVDAHLLAVNLLHEKLVRPRAQL